MLASFRARFLRPSRNGAGRLAPYGQFIRFLLPLALMTVVQSFAEQVLNGGMARLPRATETLATFGLAWILVTFVASPLWQARQLGLVLVVGRRSHRTTQLFVLLSGLLLAGLLASLVFSPLGRWVIEDLHGVVPPLSSGVRQALLWLIPVPLLKGLTLLYSGYLIRARRTEMVSYAIAISIGASIVAVFAFLPAGFVQAQPLWLPLLVSYTGMVTELAVTLWGCRRYAGYLCHQDGPPLTLAYVLRFFWPLALIMAIQGFSRPLINLFVARGPAGTEALAVLTVVYALGLLPYGWLNEIRNLPPAFHDHEDGLAYIRRFAVACGLLSFGVMILLFWTPLADYVLGRLIGLGPDLIGQARMPLVIFTFFPLVVMARAYLHGISLLEHRTVALAPSAPLRIVAILVTLAVLSPFGIHGASRAIAALLSGFVAETLVVWWCLGREKGRPAVRRSRV